MATTLISPLPIIYPVMDPLMVSFQDPANLATDNEEPTELEVIIEVEEDRGSGIWKRVAEFLNPYGSDDIATVLIDRALLGLTFTGPPSLTLTGLQSIPGLTVKYRLLARDIIGGVPSGEFTETDPAYAWLAGRSFVDFGGSYSDGKAYRFLSTDGSPKYIQPGQQLHVQFLTFLAGTGIKALINARYTDDTTEVFETELGDLLPYTGYYINLPTPLFTKELERFSISLGGFFGGSQEGIIYYYKKSSVYRRELYYRNSLGGFQNFIFGGKMDELHTESGDILDTVKYPSLDPVMGESIVFNQRSADSLVLRSGWLTIKERTALKDMLLHNDVYLVVGTKLQKIIISNATHQTRKDGSHQFALELQARFAFENSALTAL